MPFDFFSAGKSHLKFGAAKAKTVGDEVRIEFSKEQMNIVNKALNKNGFSLDGDILKETVAEEVPSYWAHVRSAEMLVHYPRAAKQGNTYDDPATVNPGWLNYHNVKDLLARFFVTIHANYGKVNNWRELCIGITSLDHTGGQMPMFDYDGKNIKTCVKKDVKHLQKQFELGDATIYETRKGLHVYFFSDLVHLDRYTKMLNSVSCCQGFKNAFEKTGYSVLRVSAKYTKFDILPYKVIISTNRGATRPGRKAALIQELLRLGQECGTHFASLYPQWGRYQEDRIPWKAGGKKKLARRVKKISHAQYQVKQKLIKKMKKAKENETYKMAYANADGNNWTNTVSVTYGNTTEWTIK